MTSKLLPINLVWPSFSFWVPHPVLNRLGDKKGTNLSNVVRFNEAMKTLILPQIIFSIKIKLV